MALEFSSNRLITNGNMSTSFMSEIFPLNQKIGFSLQAIFTGAPVGSLYISVSTNGVDWIVLPGSPEAISEAGDVFYNVNDSKYSFGRFHYDCTSGSGTLNAFIDMKEAV